MSCMCGKLILNVILSMTWNDFSRSGLQLVFIICHLHPPPFYETNFLCVEMAKLLINLIPDFWKLHSKKELAHWTVDITVQFYVCWLSIQLRCNFWTVFILPELRLSCIYTSGRLKSMKMLTIYKQNARLLIFIGFNWPTYIHVYAVYLAGYTWVRCLTNMYTSGAHIWAITSCDLIPS